MRCHLLAAIAAFFVTMPTTAQAAVTASTVGTFTQVFAGPQDTAPVYNGLGTNDFNFGTGSPTTFFFAGTNGDFVQPYEPPSAIWLGSFFYYNGAISTVSGISAVTLSLITTLSEPVNPAGDGIGTLDELIYVTNTRNSSDPVASADYITFASLGIGAYVYEGQTAIFNLYGTINSPLTLSDVIVVSEENTGFVAPTAIPDTPISPVTAVPEPATWALMIAGFALVGGAIRRRHSAGARVVHA